MSSLNKVFEMTRIAWGITGSGDKIEETSEAMIQLQKESDIRIDVYISKAGKQVLRWYKLWDKISDSFKTVKTEVDSNVPFIAGPLQMGKYAVLMIAPLTANSAAKIAYGIEDTLLTNAVAQTLKGDTPVFLYPVDQTPGKVETMAPNGTKFTIKMRAIDLENVERLRNMEGVTIVASVEEMIEKIKTHIGLI
jgi:archaeoflavoprotein AfpA